MAKPPCHNRPAFTDPRSGWYATGGVRDCLYVRSASSRLVRGRFIEKPVYRYRWPWFDDTRCMAHERSDHRIFDPAHPDYGQDRGASLPASLGWNCTGCRLAPTQVTMEVRDGAA